MCLVILTDRWGNPKGVREPRDLELTNVFGGICIDDEGRGQSSSLLLFCSVLPGSLHTVVSAVLLPGPGFRIRWHSSQRASQAEVIQQASHPPLGFVHGLTLLLAASKVSPNGGVLFHWPYWPGNGS
jgi:hypothetical protein